MRRMKKRHGNVLVLGGPYMQNFYSCITRSAMKRNWYLEVDERYNPPRDWRGDGVFSMHLDVPVMNGFLDDVLARGIPVVDLIDVTGRTDFGSVATDETALANVAARHFRERNFRHAAFFAMEWTPLHQRRYDAFATAFGEPRPEKWSWPDESQGDTDRRALAEWTARKLKTAPKPVAVLTFNAYNASFLLSVCNNHRMAVPQEAAILAGMDNAIYTQHREHPISGIEHDIELICDKAADLLQRMMDGRCAHNVSIRVPPRGIAVRSSTDALAVADPVLRKALIHATHNISRPFGPTQLAERTGVTLARLNQIAERELGRSMLDEIIRLRIEEAKRLMKETDGKLASIARLAGFCNASYFCKTFLDRTGITPHTWRTRIKKQLNA